MPEIKKIFITIPWFYPAYKAGGPVQSIVNMISELKEGFEYRIFCSDTDLNEEPLPDIEKDRWTHYNDYTEVWYASRENRSNTLVNEVKKYDPHILYIVGLFSWHFNIVPIFFCEAKKKILSVRGMLHSGALSQKKGKKLLYLVALKLSGKHKKLVFHATDEEERQQIRKNFSNAVEVKVASNFPRLIGGGEHAVKEAGSLRMISVALISPMKNHLLILKSLASVTANILYDIYGPVKDQAYWQQCIDQIKLLPANIIVRYNGDVQPVLVPQLLHQNDLFVMPSKSENFAHAIVEALSAGLPVITSHHTPWNRLESAKAGINTTETEDGLASAIRFFAAMNETELLFWRQGAKDYISKEVNIAQIKNSYKNLFS